MGESQEIFQFEFFQIIHFLSTLFTFCVFLQQQQENSDGEGDEEYDGEEGVGDEMDKGEDEDEDDIDDDGDDDDVDQDEDKGVSKRKIFQFVIILGHVYCLILISPLQ